MPQTKLDVIITAKDMASSQIKGLNNSVSSFTRTTSMASKALFAMKAALGVALVLALKDAIQKTVEFDKSMRNVDSIAKLTEDGLIDLKKEVINLSKQNDVLYQSADTLAKGLYDVYSSGFDGKLAMEVLEVSAKGAGAGLTDTATSAKALMGIMNAYNRKTGKDAKSIMDVLFKTVDKGVITFEELAQNIGDVVATSSAAKIPIEVVGAALATMTKKGITSAEAVTALNQTILMLLKPTDAMKAALKDLGYESGLTAVQTDGLDVVLAKLWKQSGQSVDTFIELWGNVRAGKGALALASDGAKSFSADLKTMETASGSTQAAIERQAKSSAAQYDALSKNADALKITIGEQLLPTANKMMAAFVVGLPIVAGAFRSVWSTFLNGANAIGASFSMMGSRFRNTVAGIKLNFVLAKGALKSFWNSVSYYVNLIVGKFNNIRSSVSGLLSPLSNAGNSLSNFFGNVFQKRQMGGPATSGSPYMVGENGPELFVPNQSGNVVPNSKLGGGVTVNIYGNINNRDGLTPNRIADLIGRQIELSMQGAR